MEELRRLREEAGLSQAQLARESGVDRATINKIEQGKRSPSMGTLESLARAMSAEIGDFFPKAQAPLLPPEPGSEIGAYLERVNRQLERFLSGEEPKLVAAGLGWEALQLAKRTAPQSDEARRLWVLVMKAVAEADPDSRYMPLERQRLDDALEGLEAAPEARQA